MWAIYALLSAFFAATSDPVAKKSLKNGVDEYIVGWATILFSTPFLAIFCFHPGAAFSLNPSLLKTLALVMPFEIAATVLYYRALRLTDISLSVPFIALTPIFVCLTGFILLGEKVRGTGIAGIILITVGVYSINIKDARSGPAHPIFAIFRNKGSLYMVVVAILFSVTSAMSKKAMLFSTPEAIPFIYNLSLSITMLPVVLYRMATVPASRPKKSLGTLLLFCLLGLLAAFSSIFYFKSVSLTNVAYAISIKRLSLLMSVGYGWLFFRERDIHIRLTSTLCMVLGVALIALS